MENAKKQNELKDKKVIILGGSAGLGLATAKAAAYDGANVIIVSSNQKRIDDALTQLPDYCTGYAVNLNQEEQIKSFFERVGSFDHLVYTAGENITRSIIDDTVIEQAKDFFNIRFWGAFAAIKYGKKFISQNGSITLMSGSFGQRPSKGYCLGATLCGTLNAFTRAMAVELAPIRVNNVAAGIIKTDLWNNLDEDDRNNFYQHLENTLLLKRVGEAEDIARAIVYLIKQTYTTGQSLLVDGGAVLV
jgi:NAD(P)-dependent dehydrogenase (short-subunit alcohol dehydrogenase family)